MAMSYQNFASLGVNLNRQKYGPLDISNVFTSAADLKYYLTKGTFTTGVSEYWYKNADEKIVPYPYEGQVLATVIDGAVEVFVLALDAEGNFETREIAGKIEVDGTTIVKDADGKLSIVAPVDPDSSKTYNFTYANGVYSWVEVDTATAAGQAQAIAGLTDRATAIENTLNGTGEGEEHIAGLVEQVAANAQAIADEASARATAIQAEATAARAAQKALGERIDSIDFVDATELSTAITDALDPVNAEIAKKAAQTDLEALEARVNAFLTGEGTTAALDSLQELIAYIDEHDGADLTEMIATIEGIESKLEGIDTTVTAYVTAAIEALKIGDYAKAADLTTLAGRVDALEAKPFDSYATKTELSDAVDGIENDLLAYAKTADVNTELAKKVESATIAHAVAADPQRGIEAIPEGVTKEGTTLKIVVDAPTRAETTQMIADKVAAVTGGESAAAVKLLVEAETERSIAKDEAHDAALAVLNGDASKAGSVAEAKALAQKGVDDAAAVAADLVTANAAIADNTREIGVAKSSIETVNTTLTEKITALENADTKVTGDITTLQGIVGGEGGHASRITALEGRATNLEAKDTELAALIQGNTDKFKDYSTTEQMNAAIEAAITGADLSTYAKVTDLEAIYKAGEGEAAATGILAEEITRAKAAEKANADAIAAIVGDDSGKTIRAIAAEETAAIVAGADTKYDTLKEIADFIMNDETGAAKMANDIADIQAAIGDTDSGLTKAIADNAAAIAAIVQPKASTEVSVAADGTLGINEMNVNKLVQTEGDTLILDGGRA